MDKTKNNIPLITFFAFTIITSAICYLFDSSFFSRYLGTLNPVILYSVIGLVAYLSINYITKFGWTFMSKSSSPKKLFSLFLLTIALGFMPVLIDTWHHFPIDINVAFPRSLIFYPVIGVLADAVFHLLPVSLLLILFGRKINRHPWVIIILVAAVEPFFQVIAGMGTDGMILRDIFVFIEVFIFGIVQVAAFSKYGFLAMYICRLGFYLTWHIVWGYARLGIL